MVTQIDGAKVSIDPAPECTAIQSIIRILFAFDWALLKLEGFLLHNSELVSLPYICYHSIFLVCFFSTEQKVFRI